jgi:hypothetical protein
MGATRVNMAASGRRSQIEDLKFKKSGRQDAAHYGRAFHAGMTPTATEVGDLVATR